MTNEELIVKSARKGAYIGGFCGTVARLVKDPVVLVCMGMSAFDAALGLVLKDKACLGYGLAGIGLVGGTVAATAHLEAATQADMAEYRYRYGYESYEFVK